MYEKQQTHLIIRKTIITTRTPRTLKVTPKIITLLPVESDVAAVDRKAVRATVGQTVSKGMFVHMHIHEHPAAEYKHSSRASRCGSYSCVCTLLI